MCDLSARAGAGVTPRDHSTPARRASATAAATTAPPPPPPPPMASTAYEGAATDSADETSPPSRSLAFVRPVYGTCRRWAAAALAEFTGTALLVLLGCLPAACDSSPAPQIAAALGTGLVVVLLVQTFDHVSGAFFNPTVTLASVLTGRVPVGAGALLMGAQCAGSTLGYGALLVLAATGPGMASARALCVTMPAPGVGALRALAVEGVLSCALVLANCGAWDARNRRLVEAWPIKIGLVVAALSYAGGSVTGASMNPARSLGPALWTRRWTAHWVYWAGPLGASCATALLYRSVWAAPAHCAPRSAPSPPPARALSTHKQP